MSGPRIYVTFWRSGPVQRWDTRCPLCGRGSDSGEFGFVAYMDGQPDRPLCRRCIELRPDVLRAIDAMGQAAADSGFFGELARLCHGSADTGRVFESLFGVMSDRKRRLRVISGGGAA